jgi:hypothetical protein
MIDKFPDNRPDNPSYYYYKDKPLQHFYKNTYSKEEKLEIIMQLESDYKAGMLSVEQCRWIYNNQRYGSYTATRIMDEMMNKKIIKRNPVTGDSRRFSNPSGKTKSIFDW